MADLRVLIVALWSLTVLAFAVQVSWVMDRRCIAVFGGSLAAVGLFALNVTVATPLPTRWITMTALQISTMVWAAINAVVLYRLVSHVYDRRTGAFAGASKFDMKPSRSIRNFHRVRA